MTGPWVHHRPVEAEIVARALDATRSAQVRAFAEDGYLVVRGAVDPVDAAAGAASTDRMLGGDPTPGARVQDAWRRDPAIRRIALAPAILDLLELLYDRRPVPFQTLSFRRGTQQRAHADAVHFSTIPDGFICGVWVALEDVDEGAGPLFAVPGSHVLPHPVAPAPDPAAFDHPAYEDEQEERLERSGMHPRPLLVSQGDAVVWAATTRHGGTAIARAGATRRSQVTHYTFSDCILYAPMGSDPAAGQHRLKPAAIDIASRRSLPLISDGVRYGAAPVGGGRSRLVADPDRRTQVGLGLRALAGGLPAWRARARAAAVSAIARRRG